jgi:hypothetical protein
MQQKLPWLREKCLQVAFAQDYSLAVCASNNYWMNAGEHTVTMFSLPCCLLKDVLCTILQSLRCCISPVLQTAFFDQRFYSTFFLCPEEGSNASNKSSSRTSRSSR